MRLQVVEPADDAGLVRVEAAGVSGRCVWPGAPGAVVDVDEQDVATLRLPGDGIFLVDTAGEPPPDVIGRAVTVHLAHVLISPTHL